MIPEISPRCPSCGASVREPDALFCHECGKPVSKPAEPSAESEANQSITEPAAEADTEASADSESSVSEPPKSEPQATNQPTQPAEPVATSNEGAVAQTAHRRGDKTRERLHRASGVARGVTRGVMKEPVKQVEKIRHVSSVVIEEASYDPSLRFVLVALGLFMIFVVLLVLSKVMG